MLERLISKQSKPISKSNKIHLLLRQYKDDINTLENVAKKIPPNELTTFKTYYDPKRKKATTLQETLLQRDKFPIEALSVKIYQYTIDGSKSCVGFDRIQIKKVSYWLYFEDGLNINQGVATLENGERLSVTELRKDVQIGGGKRRTISILFDSNKIELGKKERDM